MYMTDKTEFDLLKERAKLLGIDHSPNIGLDTLRERINAKVSRKDSETEDDLDKRIERIDSEKEATKLIRVNVSCMNPNKKDWEGEFIMVGNSAIGLIKKYIPYNVDWHVPNIILNNMKSRKFTQFYTSRDKDKMGNRIRKHREVPEFAINELPPLTEKELAELASDQRSRNATEDSD